MPQRLYEHLKRPEVFLLSFGAVILTFNLLDKSAHRTLFYVLLPVFLIHGLRAGFVQTIAQSRLFQGTVALGLLYFLSILWSTDQLDIERWFAAFKGFAFGTIFMLATARYLAREQVGSFFVVLASAGILSVLLAILISYVPLLVDADPMPYRPGMIFRGENPNIAGFLIGFTILLLAVLGPDLAKKVRQYKSLFKIFLVLALGVLLWALVLTQSRSAIGAVIVSIMLLGFLKANVKIIVAAVLLALSIGGLVLAEAIPGGDMIARGFNARLEVWTQTFEQALTSPYFGNGAGADVRIVVERTGEVQSSAHNIFLGVFYDLGVMGLLVFCAVLGMAVAKAFSCRAISALPLVLLVFGACVGLFEFHSYFLNLNREWLVWWLPIGMVLGFQFRADKNVWPDTLRRR